MRTLSCITLAAAALLAISATVIARDPQPQSKPGDETVGCQ